MFSPLRAEMIGESMSQLIQDITTVIRLSTDQIISLLEDFLTPEGVLIGIQ